MVPLDPADRLPRYLSSFPVTHLHLHRCMSHFKSVRRFSALQLASQHLLHLHLWLVGDARYTHPLLFHTSRERESHRPQGGRLSSASIERPSIFGNVLIQYEIHFRLIRRLAPFSCPFRCSLTGRPHLQSLPVCTYELENNMPQALARLVREASGLPANHPTKTLTDRFCLVNCNHREQGIITCTLTAVYASFAGSWRILLLGIRGRFWWIPMTIDQQAVASEISRLFLFYYAGVDHGIPWSPAHAVALQQRDTR
jgi:hypothetical protein